MTRNSKREQIENYTVKYGDVCKENNLIDINLYEQYGVKRGLRDKNGEGVLAGLTNISMIKSQEIIDGKRVLFTDAAREFSYSPPNCSIKCTIAPGSPK